jgi:hypothetical protein
MHRYQIVEAERADGRDPFAANRRDLSAIREMLDREQVRLTAIAAMLDRAWEAIHENQAHVTPRPR